jgi:hypothetical protein
VKVLGAVLLTLGLECVVLGFASYMAELWVRHEIPGDEEAPPRTLVTLAEFIRTLTHASPLVALTVLGTILIALGVVLRRLGTDGRSWEG